MKEALGTRTGISVMLLCVLIIFMFYFYLFLFLNEQSFYISNAHVCEKYIMQSRVKATLILTQMSVTALYFSLIWGITNLLEV